jgi:hypothetical protein
MMTIKKRESSEPCASTSDELVAMLRYIIPEIKEKSELASHMLEMAVEILLRQGLPEHPERLN